MQLGLRVVSRALKTGFGKAVRMVAMLLGGVVALEGRPALRLHQCTRGSAVRMVNRDFSLVQSITGLTMNLGLVLSPIVRLFLSSWRMQSGGSHIG